jgi:hypothetical protein
MIDHGKQIEILGALARHSLFAFIWKSFDLLHPSDRFVQSWYIDAIAHQLEEVLAGRRKRLVITVPPRYLKSISAAVAFPAWWLGKDPSIKIMVASYGAELSTKHARDFRTHRIGTSVSSRVCVLIRYAILPMNFSPRSAAAARR